MQLSFFKKVYLVVKKIPKGKVATYGQIATVLGNPRMARQVGWALHVNPEPMLTPCHRVVNKNGRISSAFAFGGENKQKEFLLSEGVQFKDSVNVLLSKFCCKIEDLL